MTKKELVLEKLIENYINTKKPISSSFLSNELENIAASTIRLYFKKLTEEGYLAQIHTSSGRIPTIKALEKYWEKKLLKNSFYFDEIKEINKISKKYNISFFGIVDKSIYLKDVIKVENKFLILDFEKEQIVIPFNKKLYLFMQDLIGIDGINFFDIITQMGLNKIIKKYEVITKEFIIKSKNAEINLIEFKNFSEGIKVENETIVIKKIGKIKNDTLKFVMVGNIYENFYNFLLELRR